MKFRKKIFLNIRKFIYRVLLLFVSFLLFILIFNRFIGFLIHINKETVVPNLINIKFNDAKNLLKSSKLYIEKDYDAYSELPIETIISQFPEPNAVVRERRTIKVVISKGIKSSEIPDLYKTDIKDLDIILKNYGLEKGKIEFVPSTSVEKNKIISQYPLPKTAITRGSKVNIKVSSGLPKDKKLMPPLLGVKEEVANILLDNANIKYEIQYTKADDKKGIVISQTPGKDEEIKPGQKVIIEIGE